MANQVYTHQLQSDNFTVDSVDIPTGGLDLINYSYAVVPTIERDDVALSMSASSVPSYTQDVTPGKEAPQTAHSHQDSTFHATSTQDVYQRWFSTLLDVLVSFVPLFFFSKWSGLLILMQV
jgi:hypothetical protein